MLKEPEPVIGLSQWDDKKTGKEDKKCIDFKKIPNGNIVLVRKGMKAIALCQIISDNFHDDELKEKYSFKNFRKVKILAWAKDYRQSMLLEYLCLVEGVAERQIRIGLIISING